MSDIYAYPPLFWGKWPKHRIDKQKLYKSPFATMFISHTFPDISAIIEISETHKSKFDIKKFSDSWFFGIFWTWKISKTQRFVVELNVNVRLVKIMSHSASLISQFCGAFSRIKDSNQYFRSKIMILRHIFENQWFCSTLLRHQFFAANVWEWKITVEFWTDFIATQGWVFFSLRKRRKSFISDEDDFEFAINKFPPLKSCRFWTFDNLWKMCEIKGGSYFASENVKFLHFRCNNFEFF